MVPRNNTRRLKLFTYNKDVLVNEENMIRYVELNLVSDHKWPLVLWVPVFAVAYRSHLVRISDRQTFLT